jgi:hypothetical protein
MTCTIEDYIGTSYDDLMIYHILKTPIDPYMTFHDDPFRILRSIRFSVRYHFTIDPRIALAAQDKTIQSTLQTKKVLLIIIISTTIIIIIILISTIIVLISTTIVLISTIIVLISIIILTIIILIVIIILIIAIIISKRSCPNVGSYEQQSCGIYMYLFFGALVSTMSNLYTLIN